MHSLLACFKSVSIDVYSSNNAVIDAFLHFHLHLLRSKPSRIIHSQKTNEQDNQAHNMLSQLPAATDRK